MRIKDFMEDCRILDDKFKTSDGRKYSEIMEEQMSVWSNQACIGYCKYACKDIGLDEATTSRLINSVKYAFDMRTVEEAEQI